MDNKRFDWVNERGGYRNEYQASRAQGRREQLEWITHQLHYASFAEKFKLRYDLKKGEIYEIDWGINVNAEFSSRHYGVVLADSGIYNPLVMVCPLKTNHQGAHPRSDIDLGLIPDLNSTKSTLAIINQIRTVDKLRIFTKKAIGQNGVSKVHDIEDLSSEEMFIPRLEDKKLKLIIESYITILINGDY